MRRRRKIDWVVFVVFLGLVGASYVSWSMADRALDEGERDRIAADRAMSAAAVERTAAIEDSRRDVLIRACREQNANHRNAIRELDRRLAPLPPEQRARSREFTVAMIGTLAPHRDCAKRADRLIR